MDTPNYRAPEAAKYLGLAESTLAKLRLSGNGPPFAKAGRAVIYARLDLDVWLGSLKRRSTSEAPKASADEPRRGKPPKSLCIVKDAGA